MFLDDFRLDKSGPAARIGSDPAIMKVGVVQLGSGAIGFSSGRLVSEDVVGVGCLARIAVPKILRVSRCTSHVTAPRHTTCRRPRAHPSHRHSPSGTMFHKTRT